MEIENLLILRNTLNTEFGEILHKYISDTITDKATSSSIDALEIKGMCKLHQILKDIPKEVERIKRS